MAPGNGDPVTWREAELLLAPVRSDLRDLKADIAELRSNVHAFSVLAERRAFLGARGRSVINGLLIAVPAGVVSIIVSLVAHN